MGTPSGGSLAGSAIKLAHGTISDYQGISDPREATVYFAADSNNSYLNNEIIVDGKKYTHSITKSTIDNTDYVTAIDNINVRDTSAYHSASDIPAATVSTYGGIKTAQFVWKNSPTDTEKQQNLNGIAMIQQNTSGSTFVVYMLILDTSPKVVPMVAASIANSSVTLADMSSMDSITFYTISGTSTSNYTQSSTTWTPLTSAPVSSVNGSTGAITVPYIHYAECSTTATTQTKVITLSEVTSLTSGLCIRVKFRYNQNYNGQPKLQVNSLTAAGIVRNATTAAARYEWLANEIVDFVYDGTNFVMVNGGVATTTYYGFTKLVTSATSTSEALALTPRSLYYTLQQLVTGLNAYSSSATYAVGDRVIYQYKLYECNTAITTAESWTEAHWTELDPILTQLNAKASAPKVATISVSTTWSGNDPYTQTVTPTGATVTANSKVDLQLNATTISQIMDDGVQAMYVENNNGVLTLYALGNTPTVALTIQCTITETV